jgi:hypothetical protein
LLQSSPAYPWRNLLRFVIGFLTESPRRKTRPFFHSERENFLEASKWIERGFVRRRQSQPNDL